MAHIAQVLLRPRPAHAVPRIPEALCTRAQARHLLRHLHTCTHTQTDGQIDIQSVIFAAGKQAQRGC